METAVGAGGLRRGGIGGGGGGSELYGDAGGGCADFRGAECGDVRSRKRRVAAKVRIPMRCRVRSGRSMT